MKDYRYKYKKYRSKYERLLKMDQRGGALNMTTTREFIKEMRQMNSQSGKDNPPIWWCFDDDNLGKLEVLATGPIGPCNKCIFHITLDCTHGWPESPPKAFYHSLPDKRIHPNFYENGYICLSILGTWRGSPGEGWTKGFPLSSLSLQLMSEMGHDNPLSREPAYHKCSIYDDDAINYSMATRYLALLTTIMNINKLESLMTCSEEKKKQIYQFFLNSIPEYMESIKMLDDLVQQKNYLIRN